MSMYQSNYPPPCISGTAVPYDTFVSLPGWHKCVNASLLYNHCPNPTVDIELTVPRTNVFYFKIVKSKNEMHCSNNN